MRGGIVGLEKAGKTTLLRLLTGGRAVAASDRGGPAVGVAVVPDPRLDRLAQLYQPRKVTYAAMEFLDVGYPAGEGESAAWSTRLREVDLLIQVVRGFEHPAYPPPAGRIDPRGDIERFSLELLLRDLEQATRRLERIEKELKKRTDPRLEHERQLLTRCVKALEAQQPLRELEFSREEEKILAGFAFLTRRPLLYVLNLDDRHVTSSDAAAARYSLEEVARRTRTALVTCYARLEAELAEMGAAEAAELRAAYGLEPPAAERILRASFELLGMISFFTLSERECRAWAVPLGTTAAEAAGVVHTDFERRFIRAEVVSWQDLLAAGSWAAAQQTGRIRLQGRNYPVQDGDVLLIRHTA